MSNPRFVRLVGNILPPRIKSAVRPVYKQIYQIYIWTRVKTGTNYDTYKYDGKELNIHYDIGMNDAFGKLISDGMVNAEEIPLDMLDLNDSVDQIIDLGGHFGVYTVLLAKLNPDTDLHVFEPDEYNRSKLEKILELNGIRAAVHPEVVSGISGTVTFYKGPEGSMSHTATPQDGFTPVRKRTIALSDFVQPKECDRIFIKIDTEGAEFDILKDLATISDTKIEGLVELHPDKLDEPVSSVITFLNSECEELSFIRDTSPTHPKRKSINHEYNRPMYWFRMK